MNSVSGQTVEGSDPEAGGPVPEASIQPHGVLLALDDEWKVRQASASVVDHLEIEAEELIGRPLEELLRPDSASCVLATIQGASDGLKNPISVPLRNGKLYDGALHPNEGLTILELEEAEPEGMGAPDPQAIDPCFQLIQSVLAGIQGAADLSTACQLIASKLRAFVNFDRVLVYRFDEDHRGEVAAESVAEDLEPYLGYYFPESEIPRAVRELYVRRPIRIVVDTGKQPSQLVPALHPLTGRPTDLSRATLSSVPPVYLDRLLDMGVGSSVGLSILEDGKPWGVIVCQHRSPRRLTYSTRAALVLLSNVVASQLISKRESMTASAVSERRILYARVLNEAARNTDLAGSLEQSSAELLSLFDADGVALWLGEESFRVGSVPELDQVAGLVGWVAANIDDQAASWRALADAYPPAARFSEQAAGLLAIALEFDSYLLFFREPQRRQVRWVGAPWSAARDPGAKALPGDSLAPPFEVVQQRCVAWSNETLRLAQEFSSALSLLIINRNRQLVSLNETLEARNKEIDQLVHTISHDLRSPLVSCKGFLAFLRSDLQSDADVDWEDSLGEIDIAIDHMGDILDDLLAYSRIGRDGEALELVEVRPLIDQLLTVHRLEAEQEGVAIEVEGDLPAAYCRPRQFMRALDNLIINALKYGSDAQKPRIRIFGSEEAGQTTITVGDNGGGIPEQHHARIFELFQRLDNKKSGSGLGLASVMRMAQSHGGGVRLESSPGHGAEFTIHIAAGPMSEN